MNLNLRSSNNAWNTKSNREIIRRGARIVEAGLRYTAHKKFKSLIGLGRSRKIMINNIEILSKGTCIIGPTFKNVALTRKNR
jgi:hypothetical protein